MSLIASFWTLEAERRSEIVEAFKPLQVARKRRWLIFQRTKIETIYPWFDYMQAHAHEEAEFDQSGMVMADLHLVLAGNGGSVFDLGLPESEALSEHSQGTVALFDEERARAALARLESFELTEADVVRGYDAEGKPEGWHSDPRSVIAAHRQLIAWLRTVVPGRIGLLMVG